MKANPIEKILFHYHNILEGTFIHNSIVKRLLQYMEKNDLSFF